MNSDAQVLKAQGNQAFQSQQYKKAAKIYRDAIKIDPSSPALWSNRAQCFLKLNDYERAVRDCTSGLELNPQLGLRIKLYYRKGLALKGLGNIEDSAVAFKEVLKLDPSNAAAQGELKSLNLETQDRKRLKTSSGFEIPIQEVDALPEPFSSVYKSNEIDSKAGIESEIKTIDVNMEESESPENSTGHVNTNKTQPDLPFSQRSSMHLLAGLKLLTPEKKVNGYNYIFNLDTSEYYGLFGSTSIDAEFLEFYLEAVAYISSNNSPDTWKDKALEALTVLSKFKRYSLSLDFCAPRLVNTILENVSKIGDGQLLSNYKTVLQR